MRIRPQFFSDDSPQADEQPDVPFAPRDPGFRQHQTFGEEPLKIHGFDVSPAAPAFVSVRLGDVLQPLASALLADRTFLRDFADDQLQLPADLLACLQASGHIHRAA